MMFVSGRPDAIWKSKARLGRDGLAVHLRSLVVRFSGLCTE